MSTIVHRLIHRLRYGATEERRVMIFGLDYAGKTTLLYLLKLGEIVTTIPSIGFNVETVEIKGSGKPLHFTGWDIGSGCGGMRYLKAILPMYIAHSDAVIWLVDAGDKGRLDESVETLVEVLGMVDREAEKTGKNKSEYPILILANKSDKPGALTIDQIRIAFSKVISGRLTSIYKTSLISTPTGLTDAFDWLNFAFNVSKKPPPAPSEVTQWTTAVTTPDTTHNPRSATNLAQKLESWLARSENDTDALSDDDLLSRFRSFNLPDWDHYTHIRLAYVILTKYGRKEGKDMLFKGLENYIAVSPDTKGKTFHLSMTYFWIQIVHFGIRNMPPDSQQVLKDTASSSSISGDSTESTLNQSSRDVLKPFSEFLIINPHVADSNLWSEYYSKSTLMTPQAKAEMVLPDKKPLPNLVVRDAIKNFGSTTYDAKAD